MQVTLKYFFKTSQVILILHLHFNFIAMAVLRKLNSKAKTENNSGFGTNAGVSSNFYSHRKNKK